MSRNVVIGVVVVVVLLAGGWWYLNQSSAPAASEITEMPTLQDITTNQVSQQNTKVSTQPSVSPLTPTPQTSTNVPSQQNGRAYFAAYPDRGPYPTEDWLTIAADGSVDLTGWSVRSTQSGRSFIIGTIGGNRVIVGEDVGAFVHTVGSPTKNYSAGNEYHLYFGDPGVAWGKEHDAIQLVNPSGTVVDTYSYVTLYYADYPNSPGSVVRRITPTAQIADATLKLLFDIDIALKPEYIGVSLVDGVATVSFKQGAHVYLDQAPAGISGAYTNSIRKTLLQFKTIQKVQFAIDGQVITDWDA